MEEFKYLDGMFMSEEWKECETDELAQQQHCG